MVMRLVFALLSLALVACSSEVDEKGHPLIPVEIIGLYDYPDGGVGVFLKGNESRVVPIIIGPFEARALRLAISKKELPRPLAYDLLLAVLKHTDAEVRHLVIHSIKDNIFHAELVLDAEGKTLSLDCRPSDGMVLVTRLGVPIYVTVEVMEETGTNLQETKKVRWNSPVPAAQFSPRRVTF
jgi:bifunctional DNase/RNase